MPIFYNKTNMAIPVVLTLLVPGASAQKPATAATQDKDNMDSWQDARFGMMITWGLHSIPERGEWIMYQEHIPHEEYKELAQQFDPKDFHPKEWAALAKEAGMKYVVFVTRHHDGYSLFDSKVSDFTSVKTAAKRDFTAEVVEAFREAGLKIGLYYSLVDWRFPGLMPRGIEAGVDKATYKPMVEQAHAQVRELLTNYGKIDILWYDMLWPYDVDVWRSKELNAMARALQPEILINDRAGVDSDFGTPENTVMPSGKPWESCYTMNRSWAYCPNERNYKSPNELIRLLVACVSENGNFLLNVSPDPRGRIPIEQVERLREMGKWMKVNSKSIYGAGKSPIDIPSLGMATYANGRVYLQMQRWPGTTAPLAWFGSKVTSAKVLTTGTQARIVQKGDRLWLHDLPAYPPDPYMNVVELEFEGEAKPSNPPYR